MNKYWMLRYAEKKMKVFFIIFRKKPWQWFPLFKAQLLKESNVTVALNFIRSSFSLDSDDSSYSVDGKTTIVALMVAFECHVNKAECSKAELDVISSSLRMNHEVKKTLILVI